jgi:hypothetical protein
MDGRNYKRWHESWEAASGRTLSSAFDTNDEQEGRGCRLPETRTLACDRFDCFGTRRIAKILRNLTDGKSRTTTCLTCKRSRVRVAANPQIQE